jgi:plasmid stabilization system protein ParE
MMKTGEDEDSAPRSDKGGVWFELRDAISLRAFLLVVGTLALGLGFVVSYVGALHNPRLQNLPVTIVSDNPQATAQLVSRLESSVPSGLLVPSAGTSVAAATEQVKDRKTGAVLVYNLSGKQDTLIYASAAGSAQSQAVQKLFTAVEQKQGRTLEVDDVVPAGAKDFDGLSAFYLVVGWCVTGYLISSILGISAGARPSTTTRAVIRLVALALAGFVAAAVGTWIVQQHVLGALGGSFWPMVATGTLLILGVGAVTMALQIAFGVIGIGLAVLLVVVLGNPSAGGAFPRSMLPTFWRSIGAFLPPGAGTDSVRSIAYFGGAQTGYPLLIMGAYALLGIVLSLLLCALRSPSAQPSTQTSQAS